MESIDTQYRVYGGGRKPILETIDASEVLEARIKKVKVKRSDIQDGAHVIAKSAGYISFKASDKWVYRFLKRHQLSLRWRTNLTTLTYIPVVEGQLNI